MIIAGGGTSSLAYSFTLAIGLVAGALSGIIGAGSSALGARTLLEWRHGDELAATTGAP